MKTYKIIISAAIIVSVLLFSFSLSGCFKVYTEPKGTVEEGPDFQEEPPPEEHHEEEPPPEDHHEEEPPPEKQQNSLSEEDIKRKAFNAAQYQIENNSIYKDVVFNTAYDPHFINKVTGYDNKFECGIEFTALDTNVNKKGNFVWVFVVSYNPDNESCYVETGSMQSEMFF